MEAPSDMSIVEWEKLSLRDREGYLELRTMLTSPACKNRRNKSVETFVDVVETIKAFVMRDDSDDLQRGIVCGMYWVGEDLAINTRQLRILLQKCKSSINGSLQMIGYASPTDANEASSILNKLFPFWKDNFKEMRQWTIRRKAKTPSTQVLPKNFVPKVLSNPKVEKIIQNATVSSFPTPPPDVEKENDPNNFLEFSITQSSIPEQDFDITDHFGLDTRINFEDDSFGMWNNFNTDFDL
ncbi:hypothetical protein TVAG_293580 [Trichomonas vaginalis G3]|uniref:Initiator binding domain-containing protein n=1 Tax=Trichomonas vaginalis (strain ATCC PRA-98 / G3) TaxID=412133 RepID=A2FCN1_TRIV3|nr:transcription-initiator DNA-binding domain ibd family [Trichomonas vaginalis G3]EAX97353.1 hypothetical protein TVAG_293580 [Trichomonas vaginalis G3]KAI5533146.1 transcription-initiator DNA-binding domain ibd family [Trichomonas vaginalis G3]|eukprot:XP_001310283.1 hypothetical protein [Trichomonas vaginalis G3]